jgi:hypothetical protein
MRHFLITIGTAVVLVGAFLALRARWGERESDLPPIGVEAPRAESRVAAPPPIAGGPVVITGVPELEALHLKHGRVGAAMRDFLALTRGNHWNNVNRERMQLAIAELRHATPDDLPYLLDMFNRTQDPAFRWWFSWVVQQIPDGRFVDAMTEVYRIDPDRGLDALSFINTPAAMDRYLKLMETESNPDVRLHAIVALAHSDWENREESVSEIARDARRAGAERIEALSALGRIGLTAESMALLMETALGPAAPVEALRGYLAASHPVPDVRSGAVLAIMHRGDQEAARRLMEAADASGADPNLTKIVDHHIAVFTGPDLSEFIYDRARRRQFVSAGEVNHLLRDLERVDKARLRELIPLVTDPGAKAFLQKIVSE